MTKFKTIQIATFLNEQGIKKGSSSLSDYETAKQLLFPFGRKDPITDLDYNKTIFFLTEYLRV